jgi:hypothetical protein
MNYPDEVTWWQQQHVNTRILCVILGFAFSIFVVTQMIGVAHYDQPRGEAVFNVLLVVAVTSAGVFGGIAYRHRRYSAAILGFITMLALDLGTWSILPFRESPLLPTSFTTYLFIGAVSAGVWWFSSRAEKE